MELIRIRDKHLEKPELKYGCICPICDSAFIFTAGEVIVPKTINYTEAHCRIRCPHCGYSTTLDKCEKLKDEVETNAFRLLHSSK